MNINDQHGIRNKAIEKTKLKWKTGTIDIKLNFSEMKLN